MERLLHRFAALPMAVLLLTVVSACGEDDGEAAATTSPVENTTIAVADTTTTVADTTTQPPTEAPETPDTEAPQDAEVPEPTAAAERLALFFEAAQDLDLEIRTAADLFNATYDPDTGSVGEDAVSAIDSLDATPVGRLIPGGLTVELETAVLAVFADLDSRVSALRNGMALGSGDLMHCFGVGGESAARFDMDLRAAQELLAREPASAATPGSPEAGMVAVRAAYIHGSNWCCDSCGGFAYATPMAVDWDARVFAPGEIDAPFEAVFNGEYWQVTFPEAGAGVPSTEAVLRPDGLGVVSFGDSPPLVVALVEAVVGIPPTDDTGWVPSGEVAPICPGPNVRIVEFDNLGLLFADDGAFAPSGTEQFVAYWYYGTPPLFGAGPPDGITVGSTLEDLLAVYPEADIQPESGRFGPTFSTGDGGELLWGQLTGVTPSDEIVAIFGGIGCGD